MIKYLIAFMLFTSPCLAGMGIGGFPYPGPGQGGAAAPYSFCDGSELFCTSWETGTTALNTGASSYEGTFDSIEGVSPSKITTGCAIGSACMQAEYSSNNQYDMKFIICFFPAHTTNIYF